MAEGETRSLQELKRETEATRAGLTSTVDQLRTTVSDTATEIRDRLRPDAIKAEVSDYFKSRGERLVSDVKDAARRNPMQAVAVGASIAYPLLRIARAVPVPVLMIGAGLFFAGSKTGRDMTQQASNRASDLVDAARRQTSDLTERIAGATSDAQAYAADAIDKVTNAVGERAETFRRGSAEVTGIPGRGNFQPVRDATQTVGRSVTDGISDLQGRAATLANNAASSIQDKVAGISSAVGQTASDGVLAGQDLVASARNRIADSTDRASRAVNSTIEQNPLLVAGVGLLLGGLIASVLPKLSSEDALMGGASDAVKKRAQEAAARGFEAAKGAADEIVGNVTQQAKSEGLTPDDLARGAQDLGQRVQRVAERAVATAFESDHDKQSGTGEHHG
jgi:ElaB/YqjD/DUF883 family membrane-anchored ribosome-binding protein